MSKYAKRDVSELEPYYSRHVSAMTGESLHSKSAIAAELAYRDKKLSDMTKERDELRAKLTERDAALASSVELFESMLGNGRVFHEDWAVEIAGIVRKHLNSLPATAKRDAEILRLAEELNAMVPVRPKEITYEHGWDILDFVQDKLCVAVRAKEKG